MFSSGAVVSGGALRQTSLYLFSMSVAILGQKNQALNRSNPDDPCHHVGLSTQCIQPVSFCVKCYLSLIDGKVWQLFLYCWWWRFPNLHQKDNFTESRISSLLLFQTTFWYTWNERESITVFKAVRNHCRLYSKRWYQSNLLFSLAPISTFDIIFIYV